VDEAGVDLILVGDSVATVLGGQRTTLGASMEQMEYHVSMVAAARPRALVVGDMPFGSYQASTDDAVRNAVRLVKAGAEVVKLEGGRHVADAIAAIVAADIPVMGHVGLTPQSYHRMGGNRIQGRDDGGAERVAADARAVVGAGACSFVIEGVPSPLAARITQESPVPTIGIGAGADCDGQVLVLHDLLGLSLRSPSFARAWVDLRTSATDAVARYADEVRDGSWPDAGHSFT
jgi:3-methyl-2-oxobutanoate hydroxymethyltransferase